MLSSLAKRFFGSANDRFLKSLNPTIAAINALESQLVKLDDEALKARTAAFKDRLAKGESLDKILPEAFATVREAAKRTLGQRHFDVQLLGGMVLHQGKVAEMKTGEGKTLVATLPVYLNALAGKGVHVVTVNDYLARRDSEWMGQIYKFLGLTVGCVVPGISDPERKAAYQADITYATNNELGFDYLRDNLKSSLDATVQRNYNYAIVDEVDSILIDEARTPLIISGPAADSSELYRAVDRVIPNLVAEDFEKDEKARAVTLTEVGTNHAEELLRQAGLIKEGSLYDLENVNVLHHVQQALRAHQLFRRDTDYIVKDDKVVIIDEFTGRMMEGRRFSDGLHQALEAKEGAKIQQENQTVASITFQNYFRLYKKLGGMTGTAMTEAQELGDIYGLEVLEIPTNVPVSRKDFDDEVYRSAEEKTDAIVKQIKECHQRGQPVLVGTVSIEKSEDLSARLRKERIPHQVLNARYHEQEAFIVAQAGAPGSVTIATNMAGRGTDIQLGGNVDMRVKQETATMDPDAAAKRAEQIRAEVAVNKEKVKAAGGLFVLGTERHESRRIDNQLRGRSGRQGDPGASKFYLSLQDDLMRIFGSDRMDGILKRLGLKDGEAIAHPWVNKALEKAQQKVEARNYEIRKNLLRFDNVMNDQRKVVYEQRRDIMRASDVSDTVEGMRSQVLTDLIARYIPKGVYAEQWEVGALHEEVRRLLALDLPVKDWAAEEGIADAEMEERIGKALDAHMTAKIEKLGALWPMVQKQVLLHVLDKQWKDHLLSLDHLRHGISLRAYAQRDPLIEYKREAFELFDSMLAEVRQEVTLVLTHVEMRAKAPVTPPLAADPSQLKETRLDPALAPDADAPEAAAIPATSLRVQPVKSAKPADEVDPNDPATWGKVARNAPCPCGSGKKFKHCHGTGG